MMRRRAAEINLFLMARPHVKKTELLGSQPLRTGALTGAQDNTGWGGEGCTTGIRACLRFQPVTP